MKYKRRCISKLGNVCHKGYYYEYSFSEQGKKYVQWMSQWKTAEEALCLKMLSEASPYISKDLKKNITSSMINRERMKYKGPNRHLQTLGLLIPAFPALIKKLQKAIDQKDILEFGWEQLTKTVSDQASEINKLKESEASLKEELDDKNREISRIKHTASFESMKSSDLKTKIEVEYGLAWKYLNTHYFCIIKDLKAALTLVKPEASKVCKLIYNRHKDLLSVAEKHLEEAGSYLEKI